LLALLLLLESGERDDDDDDDTLPSLVFGLEISLLFKEILSMGRTDGQTKRRRGGH
jgi:hypothetical protein